MAYLFPRKHSCRWRGMARLWMTLATLILSTLAPFARGQQDERAVRAAFVYNLTKYVEWPQTGNELVVGFVGDSDMGGVLEKVLSGKTTDGKTVRVLRNPSNEQLQRCDIVYIGYSSPKKIQPILEKLRNKSILSVGEDEHFAGSGGIVGLVRTGDHIQIQINLEVAQQAGLKISSRLLNLAAIVRTTGAGG